MAADAGSLSSFTEAAKSLSGNPLGIVALFIVLVYGFAALLTAFSSSLSATERTSLTYFLILFPFAVLAVFGGLVSGSPTNLYAPKDFKDEENYVRTIALLAAASTKEKGANATVDLSAIISTVRTSKSLGDRKGVESVRRLLWVDDRPENNILERRAFESAGYEIVLALSTQQALTLIETTKFSSIISDMGRKEGDREGYNLLKQVRDKGIATPFFIYASSNLPEHRAEALRNKAQGSTNDAEELFRLVTTATP